MKHIENYIKENNEFHLRNIAIDDELILNEDLRNLKMTEHSKERKDQTHNGNENIKRDEIIELIQKCDTKITNKLLNDKIRINDKSEQFGIRKLVNKNNCVSFACIFEVTYFDKTTFEYDLRVVSSNKVKYVYKFLKSTKFAFEIDKSGYVKEINI